MFSLDLRVTGADQGVELLDFPVSVQMHDRFAVRQEHFLKCMRSGYSFVPGRTNSGPPYPINVEEVMRHFIETGRAAVVRMARTLRVEYIIIVVFAALACYNVLGLGGFEFRLKAKVTVEVESSSVASDNTSGVTGADQGVELLDFPVSVQMHDRFAVRQEHFLKCMRSGYSPVLSAGYIFNEPEKERKCPMLTTHVL